jgi:carbonic anhydrase
MVSANDAINRLREGNKRFVSGIQNESNLTDAYRRQALLAGQDPFAVILGCSDSRVPAEIIFDQGLGDLFVIRVAGNIVAPSLIGSVEFAVEAFGVRLVVVLGHTKCGAVSAALSDLDRPTGRLSPNLRVIVDSIQPAISPLMEIRQDREALMHQAVRENIHASVKQLQNGSKILEEMIVESGLAVVGAEYSLETGEVEFFEDLSDAS